MSAMTELIGGTYYLTLASCNGRFIIDDPEDVRFLEERVARAVSREAVSIHAYCWLRRELHLGIELKSGSVGSFVRTCAACLAREKNRRTHYSGPLFSSAYGAVLIHAESLLLPLIRYLHLLPSYVGLVTDPSSYAWSSHRAYLDASRRPPWLNPTRALSLFRADTTQTLQRYTEYLQAPMSVTESARFVRVSRRALIGPSDWSESIRRRGEPQRRTPSVEQFLSDSATRIGYSLATLSSGSRSREFTRARALIAIDAIEHGIASLSEVARLFNRSPSALYLAIQAYKSRTCAAPNIQNPAH